ncbi:response regulator transcription factor [Colwellia sp. 4_MG-2023]|jgi:two-component system OmpR family response regulator|uniref:winged helix-turn-helix domain-containing protein n=1 Tax=unclassified Colwellia TaxID=196834 RepID=UPI001C0946D1|nr:MULTISPECIES: response regulator transcription factor [unclassified Colwellia]MBU2926594.1 response regulator transcription factor [Colwellia sp. C2M11]MDO6489684.1 response regulator transcription factor [Colwellia sp. 6_MG-2023]MDO6508795.1 response regulator transcription factor [Colwellia sp. 5_MG-2023]MDO6557473.1 response regulator transcription factor [Colwellia sp. 4_MG-2023]MDO6654184.1 response regulator transcription factor [Colwellia sp. 3_MG-2023]
MKLLVIEDDKTTLEYIKKGFVEQGNIVDTAENGPDGLFFATSNSYDLVVLDRMLPKMDGLALLSAMRAANIKTPVIILSALGHVDERIKGLQAGGDDYLTKPFSFQELYIRASILVERHRTSSHKNGLATELTIDNLVMDLVGHKVVRDGKELTIQPKEFQLLRYLLEHQGQVISRTLLFESVWDYHFDPKTNVIDVHVAKLRKKLEENGQPQLIHTVRGAGYVVRTI